MVTYADVCVFSEHLTKKPQRLSRDNRRDMLTYIGEIQKSVELGQRSFPRYDGQFHIDFWLSKAEKDSFVPMSVPEEDKCDHVAKVLSEDVLQAYVVMQCSRLHRGEAAIKDWPTLKAILRYVFLPLTQLDTSVLLVDLPSPDDPVSDLSLKVDSLSSSSCSCSSNKDVGERDVLKEMITAFQQKLALTTKENQEIQDLLVQCWRMLSSSSS